MEKETFSAMLAIHNETAATIAVIEAIVHALIDTHPDPRALLASFDRRIDRHHALGLASPVGDALIDGIQQKAQAVRQRISAAHPDTV